MANVNPPKRAQAWVTRVFLPDMATAGRVKAAPTIAAGDFKVDIDGGGFTNLTTLPSVSPAAGRAVLISLSATEMTGDVISIQCVDQTVPPEWADYCFAVLTTA